MLKKKHGGAPKKSTGCAHKIMGGVGLGPFSGSLLILEVCTGVLEKKARGSHQKKGKKGTGDPHNVRSFVLEGFGFL